MTDASEFLLKNSSFYNGKLSLPQTLEAYTQAVLEAKGLFAFISSGDYLLCKKCGAPYLSSETVVSVIIEHAESHLSSEQNSPGGDSHEQ